MSDEPSTPTDLSAIDLSLTFAPAWAKDADSGERLAKLAARHDREDRPERGGKGRGPRDDRAPRSDRRPPRREGGPRRDDKRGGRTPERRPERPPEPTVKGWTIQFLADRHGVEGLAKQIKTSAKAYPLFDLARLVLEKSERYLVEFKRASDDATALYQVKADGTLWLGEGAALTHALATQLDKYYRREQVAVEPPKGNYAFVAVCGLSGTVLGPPNFHDYQSKLLKLHAERFANMPFDAFKSRIRMERGEEFIEKWKEEQSSKDVFHPLDLSAKAANPAPAAEAPVETPEEASTAETASLVEEAAPAPAPAAPEEIPALEATVEAPVAETPVDAEATASEEPAPAPETTPAGEPSSPRLESLAEVERHFREHHFAKGIVRIRERVVVPGPAAMNESAPAVLQLTRGAWQELSKFPLPIAHHLGQQLASRNLQIFKTKENFTHVGVARPKFLDVAVTPVSPALSEMLAYIEAHPAVPRAEQWKALVALRPAPPEGAADDRETAVAADLFWLLREGHVLDFARRGLEAARRPKPPTPKKNSAPKAAPAEPAAESASGPVADNEGTSAVASEPAVEIAQGEPVGEIPAATTDSVTPAEEPVPSTETTA